MERFGGSLTGFKKTIDVILKSHAFFENYITHTRIQCQKYSNSVNVAYFLNYIFFHLLFDCLTAYFGPLLTGQRNSPNVNNCFYLYLIRGQQEPCIIRLGRKAPDERLVGFKQGTLRFISNALIH